MNGNVVGLDRGVVCGRRIAWRWCCIAAATSMKLCKSENRGDSEPSSVLARSTFDAEMSRHVLKTSARTPFVSSDRGSHSRGFQETV